MKSWSAKTVYVSYYWIWTQRKQQDQTVYPVTYSKWSPKKLHQPYCSTAPLQPANSANNGNTLWSQMESLIVKSHRLSVNFPLASSIAYWKFWRAFCSFCEKSWCHIWLQLKHDLACIEHLQISIHWTQTNWFHTPFSHCSSDSNSRLCFHSVPLGLLQLPTCWLSTVSHWQIAESSERSCTTYL